MEREFKGLFEPRIKPKQPTQKEMEEEYTKSYEKWYKRNKAPLRQSIVERLLSRINGFII